MKEGAREVPKWNFPTAWFSSWTPLGALKETRVDGWRGGGSNRGHISFESFWGEQQPWADPRGGRVVKHHDPIGLGALMFWWSTSFIGLGPGIEPVIPMVCECMDEFLKLCPYPGIQWHFHDLAPIYLSPISSPTSPQCESFGVRAIFSFLD